MPGGLAVHASTSHRDLHVVAAIDPVGHLLGHRSFPATPAGSRALLAWLQGLGRLQRVGVEGTGAAGAGLLRHLRQAGVTVVEVDRPDRRTRRTKGKSDPVDAEAAARAALAGTATGIPKGRDGPVEAIRVLRVAPDAPVATRGDQTHSSWSASIERAAAPATCGNPITHHVADLVRAPR
jgi:hypothetical protein